MISEELFFKNHFDEKKITNDRLAAFTGDMKGKLTAGNTGGRFDSILNRLGTSYPAFTGDVSDVEVALRLQKQATMTVEGVQQLFKTTMSVQYPFIAAALGGEDTPAFQQFYPRGRTQYARATQAQMTTLTTAVNIAATANATALGTTLTTLLQGFQNQWTTTKAAQNLKKGSLATGRDERNDTRSALELDLCFGIDIIGSTFPGDVASCATFVDFSLLTRTVRRTHYTKSGTIAPALKVNVVNVEFAEGEKISVTNTSTNADMEAFLVANPSDVPTVTQLIRAGKKISKPAGMFGDLTNTYFMLRNLNATNEVTYIVEYIG